MRRPTLHHIFAWTCLLANVGTAAADDAKAISFEQEILPIFRTHCFDCHAADTREAGLRLDRRRHALAGGDSGQVIVPHKPEESLLLKYVSGDDPEKQMPPDSDPLPAETVQRLRDWIAAGAPWPDGIDPPEERPDHWAYQSLAGDPVPTVTDRSRVRNPIDAFVQAKLEAEGIAPAAEADRFTLIKRLHYDLIGLPPEPDVVDQFVSDESATAYEALVDALLESPHFGERWGRHWLDQARYADSDGYEKDRPRYNAWKYRDWVIQAINDDMPFDRFTIEQLAGDLLPDAPDSVLLATAFNRQTLTNTEGGTDQEQWRVEAIFDRVETLGTVWLGLTVGCARCHTHKYDSITQREYYQLFAFFNNGDEVNTNLPTSAEAFAEYLVKKAAYDTELAQRLKPLEEARERIRPMFDGWVSDARDRVVAQRAEAAEFLDVDVVSIESEGGTEFRRLDDASYLATGKRPPQDVYTVTFKLGEGASSKPLTGFQLEALTDDSLPKKGPGRAENGNFVLSEFTVETTAPGNDGPGTPLKFSRAKADFSQKSYEVAQAIDGVEDSKGWAVGPQMGKPHTAQFLLADDAQLDTTSGIFEARLVQRYDGPSSYPHLLGRFRLRAIRGQLPESLGLPDNVQKLLLVGAEKRTKEQTGELFDYFASLDPEVRKLQQAVDSYRKQEPFKPEMTVRVLKERQQNRRTTHIFKRGDFLQPLGTVDPAPLEVLPAGLFEGAGSPRDRLALARWLVSAENPLTPRVVANRVWSHLFGAGLVRTINDFGVRGEPPTHPRLLDWLAEEFVRLGWSRKALIKTIVMSHTYRQSSAHRPELFEIDPENRWLARQNRFRVEAEIIRDLHLAASGLLERRIGGPSVFPPLPPGIAELSYANNFRWGSSDWNSRPDRPHATPPKEDVARRGLYTFFKRTAAYPNLVTFDCPDSNTTCVERRNSNTPLQALTTLNNEVYVQTAQAMAQRLLELAGADDADRLTTLFRLCIVRPPSSDELRTLTGLLSDAREAFTNDVVAARELTGSPKDLAAEKAVEQAAWTTVARIVMNLDEFIARE